MIDAEADLSMTIQYNGGHRSPQNKFRAMYYCTEDGPTNAEMTSMADMDMYRLPLDQARTLPRPEMGTMENGLFYTVNAQGGNLVEDGYTLGFTLPANATGRCSVSLLDQRKWGGCVDLMIAPKTTTTLAQVNVNPGQKEEETTTTTMTTTTMRMDKKRVYSALNTSSCIKILDNCCCIHGEFDLNLETNMMEMDLFTPDCNITIEGESMRRQARDAHAAPPTPTDAIVAHDATACEAKAATRLSRAAHAAAPMKKSESCMMVPMVGDNEKMVGYAMIGGQNYSIEAVQGTILLTNMDTEAPTFCDGVGMLASFEAVQGSGSGGSGGSKSNGGTVAAVVIVLLLLLALAAAGFVWYRKQQGTAYTGTVTNKDNQTLVSNTHQYETPHAVAPHEYETPRVAAAAPPARAPPARPPPARPVQNNPAYGVVAPSDSAAPVPAPRPTPAPRTGAHGYAEIPRVEANPSYGVVDQHHDATNI